MKTLGMGGPQPAYRYRSGSPTRADPTRSTPWSTNSDRALRPSASKAVEADVVFFAVGSVAFKTIGALRDDWSGKIVVDVTNGFVLPPEAQEAEFHGRLTSEVNAERVAGGKLVKTFNQLPLKVLAAALPDDVGRRVVFVSSDHEDASATVAELADKLGFAPIEVGRIAEGGRLIQARASLVFQNLIKYPM